MGTKALGDGSWVLGKSPGHAILDVRVRASVSRTLVCLVLGDPPPPIPPNGCGSKPILG